MIKYTDCLLLLADLQNDGIDTTKHTEALSRSMSNETVYNAIKFINAHRHLDVTTFYEKIRKSYNNKKSTVYINIMKEVSEPSEVIITLSSLLTQIFLFAKTVSDREMFLHHSRANEITKVLNQYLLNYDLTYAIKLITLIKADIKVFESMKE